MSAPHGTTSIPSSLINTNYFSNEATPFQHNTAAETIIQVGNLQPSASSMHAETHQHHHHHEHHHHGEHKHKEKKHHHHHHEHNHEGECCDSEHHHHDEKHGHKQHKHKHSHSHSHSHHDHHHHDHGHDHGHHHHHHGIQLPDLRVWIPRVKRWIVLLVQYSIQEQTRKLFYYTLSLLGMFFVQLFMAMFVSKALVLFISAFHTLQRAFHHLITLIMRAVSVANSAPSTSSTSTKCQLTAFSYGYERMEVVMRFANGIFSIFFSFALSTEAVHRMLEGEEISFKLVLLVTLLSLIQNLGGVYLFSSYGSAKQYSSFVKSKTVQSSSSTMFGSNSSKNLLTKSKRRQLFSDILFEITPHVMVFLTVILAELISPPYLDPIFTVATALVIVYFAFPTITSAATILLQTSPQKMKGALSKCLREASTIEGVLECQSFNVWSLSYGLGNLVGTLSIRVAEDADEQKVLNAVHQLFNPLFADLTIQVHKYFKSEAPPISPKVMQPISLMSEPLIQEKPFLTLSQPLEMPSFSVIVENPAPLSENMRQRTADMVPPQAPYPEMISVAGESGMQSKED